MVAPIISILSDSSKESVGSHALRVILFGAIPAIIPFIPKVPIVPADPIVAPEVGTVPVVSPTGALDLVDYSSSSDSDPSEDSLPPAPDLPLVLPFLCSDDSEVDGESEPAEQRPVSPFLLVDLYGYVYHIIHRIVILHQTHLLLVHLQTILYPDMHHQTPPMLIYLHHRDLFIDHLLGLHDE
ncbi:hypothetical protein Tco_1453650, partial [Tanacetum coccineum]